MSDLNQEALSIWNGFRPMIDQEINERTKGMVQRRKAKVTTAPSLVTNTIGVTEPFGDEMFLPFVTNLISASVGDVVWIEWMYGATNAFVSSFASADKKDFSVAGVLDVVPRRCEGVLNARGWYRVLEYSGTQYTVLGTGGAIIHVDIIRSYSNQPNETHSIDLNLVYNKIVFNAESSVSWDLWIDKIRYVVNGDKGYIDIHYDGVNENIVCVNFAVSVQQYAQEYIVSVDFQSVPDTSSDETILAMHDFVATGNNFTLPVYMNGTMIHYA